MGERMTVLIVAPTIYKSDLRSKFCYIDSVHVVSTFMLCERERGTRERFPPCVYATVTSLKIL